MINEVLELAVPVAIVASGIGVLATGYVKASPDRAFIISGLRKNPKFLSGKLELNFPFLSVRMN